MPRKREPESPRKTLFFFLKLKKYNGISEPKIINVKKNISEDVDENNSNDNKNRVITETASPSIPSIKFIELIIATIMKIVNNWPIILLN